MAVFAILAGTFVGVPALVSGQGAGAPAKPAATDLTAVKAMGSPRAPITIEVFSDYQCPQCRQFFETTTRQLVDNYVVPGKVYLVHRDFPLNMHSHSHDAARWASAAAAVGHAQFEAVEKALYAKQDVWGGSGQIEPIVAAALSPADMAKVRKIQSTETPKLDAAIQSDLSLGNTRRVNGTPSVFVTHRGEVTPLPAGGVDYSLLKQYLDYLLQH
jgi:protein-disulfide isomerase